MSQDRAARQAELSKRNKRQLAGMLRGAGIVSANPLESWRKDELISAILNREFPPVPGPQAGPQYPNYN